MLGTLATAWLVAAALPAASISADPPQVELGPGARAILRVEAPAMPVMSASAGTVERLREVGAGRFEATYVPPSGSHPQVAIIVAAWEGGYAWLPLPLAGTGEVSVRADASGSATVTIGGRRFGPQRAGPDGRTSIRIVVPPGVREAVSGGKRMTLAAPPTSHVHVTVDRDAVPADEQATVLVRAFAVTPEGRPRRAAPLRVDAGAGRLDPPRQVEPGVFESRWVLAPGPPGDASVEVALADEPASVSRGHVRRVPARPSRLALEVDRRIVTAGEGTLGFALSFADAAGNPVDDVSPRVTTSVGAFLGWTRGVPGRWLGQISIPERTQGESTIVIVASAEGLSERQELRLVPGPTAHVAVGPARAASDDGAPVALSVTTFDRFGNPTEDALPEVSAALGTVDAPTVRGGGAYTVLYHPPAPPSTGRDEVWIRAGRSERVVHVQLRAPAAAPRLALAVGGGAAARPGAFGPAVGVDASLWPFRGRRLGLVLDGSWFRFSQDDTLGAPARALRFDSTASYLALTAGPAWRQPLGGRVRISVSAGGGAARVESRSTLAGQPRLDEARWTAAGTAAVSLGARLGRGIPFLEVRALHVADPELAGLAGSFTPIVVRLGYRLDAL